METVMKGKLSLSELLVDDLDDSSKEEHPKYTKLLSTKVDEALRMRLLKQEFTLRKKQPEPWTKTKYRPFANFKARRTELEQAKLLESKKPAKKPSKKKK